MAVLRAIGAVIGSYVVIFIGIVISFSVAYQILGDDGAFEPGSYDVSTTWIIMSFVVGFVTALIGGLLCALIAGRGSKAPLALAVLLLVLGGISAIAAMNMPRGDGTDVRDADVTGMEAMMQARQPVLTLLGNPLIGAVGVLIGARLRGGRRDATN